MGSIGLHCVTIPVFPLKAAGTVRGSTKIPFAGSLKYAYVRVAAVNISTSSQLSVVKGEIGATTAMVTPVTSMNTNTNVEQIIPFTVAGGVDANVAAGQRVAIELVATGATALVTNAEAYLWFARPVKPA